VVHFSEVEQINRFHDEKPMVSEKKRGNPIVRIDIGVK